MNQPKPEDPNHTSRFDALICDIDGCLNDEHGGPLELGPLAKIAEWNSLARDREDRPIVVPCSGRPISYVEAIARHIGCQTLPIIGEMGAWMFFPDTNRHELDQRITGEHIEAVHALEAFARQTLVPEGCTIQPGKAASVTLWHESTAYLKGEVRPRIERLIEERGWPFQVGTTVAYINCDLEFVSKGSGIDRFCAHTGIEPGRLAGIGDTMSDLKIRERVAWFGCPSNADRGLQAHADVVAANAEVRGVLELLEHLR
ncbi:MAG: HAD hydrolase family protein [Planctomycetota bacterium]